MKRSDLIVGHYYLIKDSRNPESRSGVFYYGKFLYVIPKPWWEQFPLRFNIRNCDTEPDEKTWFEADLGESEIVKCLGPELPGRCSKNETK